jgi:glycosyltransferase involved in cell wall biosynthesis
MKIIQINKFFDLNGGAEIYMHELSRRQRVAGHIVHSFSTLSDRNLPSDDSEYFVKRYHLDRWDGPLTDMMKAKNFIWNSEAKRGIERMLDDTKPDVVHVHNLYHHLSSSVLDPIRKRGIPCVQTLHDYKLACPNYKMFTEGAPCERCKGGKYINAIKHKCLFAGVAGNALAAFEMGMTKTWQSYERAMSLFLCPSKFMMEKMQDWGEPRGKFRLLPNPAELSPNPATLGGGYLLYVGRLSPEKGLASFLGAACRIPELPIKIAGRGPLENELRALVRSRGASHIEFLGFLSQRELDPLRRRAEALFLPSIWYENASLAILEAMGAGLPCLTTRIGGNPELVEDDVNGFLALPDNEEDWYRILRRFQATTPEVRQKMGEASREKIRHRHMWSDNVDAVEACYREAGAMG